MTIYKVYYYATSQEAYFIKKPNLPQLRVSFGDSLMQIDDVSIETIDVVDN